MAAILVIDDEESPRQTLALLLKKRGHRVTEAEGFEAAAAVLAQDVFDVIVTDLRMPDGDGLDVLNLARRQCPDADVILLTAYAGWESAKEAIRLGAFDYFEKGRDPDEMLLRIDKALEQKALRRENSNLRQQVRDRYALTGIIARSPQIRAVLDLVTRVAPTEATVLVQGESGTGKELIAKAIHHASPRASGPFLAVNCGALPETLLESELFGHVKGAFTGATATKKGLFEEADGGTILLDEIGDMAPALQVKLLRVLQEGEVRRVGANQPITVSTRVVAATNRDLQQLMRQGSFREDLYYRLNVIPVVLPPLRERREDIPVLAEHFLERFARRQGRTLRLSPQAMERLLRYPWPGNVRELENAIERTAILARQEVIRPEDLPPHVASGIGLGAAPPLPAQECLADVEKAHILQTLERLAWNYSRAAEVLGIGRTTLWRKLKEYGLERRASASA
ncbi:MAG TPA: sigma-54 dependent transcriptional regulator [Thermodesulfobacteriota bacterium]